MPRGSKKRRADAKKKQKNRPNNQSSSSVRPLGNEEDVTQTEEKQSEVVRVESTSEEEPEEPMEKSNNGGGSSGKSSVEDIHSSKNSLPIEGISSVVEEVVTVSSVSEKVPPLLVERVKCESSVEDDGKSLNQVVCNVGKSVERNDERIVQSGIGGETERDSTVTEPLLVSEERTTWRSCCGLFEVFLGSGR